MPPLPSTLPRVTDIDDMPVDPLKFLARTRTHLGDLFVLREPGPMFSREDNCCGVVAVFGEPRIRQILSDTNVFSMPVSAAKKLALPDNLVGLNRGLHSMCGKEHRDHKKLVMRILDEGSVDSYREAMRPELVRFVEHLKGETTISLMARMRELTLQVAARVLFGSSYEQCEPVLALLQRYFMLRREASAPVPLSPPSQGSLELTGQLVDDHLSGIITRYRGASSRLTRSSIIQRLATETFPGGAELSVEEAVGHANILFVSSTEPVAVSLTWILLLLSQLPELRNAMREELAGPYGPRLPTDANCLLDRVIKESLRLLTPNALMVRITSCPVSIDGVTLPESCEIILCPFLVHREEAIFPEPDVFLPSRWKTATPTPFEYLPFGAGGRICAGKRLAHVLIHEILAELIPRMDLTLTGDQTIDWRIHIMLTPRDDPTLAVQRVGHLTNRPPPRWQGPVSELIKFESNPA